MGRDGADYEYDHDHRFDYMDEGDDLDGDCGLLPNGQCMMAGSEDCDWECPHSHGPFFAGSAGWHKRHDTGPLPLDGCECSECNAARAG